MQTNVGCDCCLFVFVQMKDFLELYNKMVYHCFDKCVSNFNNANTSAEEVSKICSAHCNLTTMNIFIIMITRSSRWKLVTIELETGVVQL